MEQTLNVGDRVKCHEPGSWVDGEVGVIENLSATASDGVGGCLLKMADCVTVVPAWCLEKLA